MSCWLQYVTIRKEEGAKQVLLLSLCPYGKHSPSGRMTARLQSRVRKGDASEAVRLSKGPCHAGPAAGGMLRRLALYLFSQTVFSMLQGYGFHELPAQVPARSTLPLLSGPHCTVLCIP